MKTRFANTLAFVMVLCSLVATAQPMSPYFTTSNSAGTDFWMTFLPAWPLPGGINNIKIYVTSEVETEVSVEVKSEGWIKTKKTKPNEVIEFVLPVTVAQPYFKIDRDPTPPEKVYRQHAVHVFSKDPIIVYGVTRYQYTSDSFLALPTSALGTEYIISSFSDVGDNGTSFGQYLPSLTSIVAPHDNTKVVFTLGGNLITRTAGGLKPGESVTITLNKGDVFPIGSFGKSADLSGSKISASKPVGVLSGNFCAYIPEDKAACDHIVEMELPAYTWGKEYVVTKIFGRQTTSFIKVMAKEPNTKIFLDGRHVYTIQFPGGVEGAGYMFRRVAEGAPKSYTITADKPITVTQHNPGQQDDNISSDPFQLVLAPLEQQSNELTFSTPGIGDGSGFSRNYVNLVFETDEKNGMPSDLQWGVVENGQIEWRPLGERYGFFFESLEAINGRTYAMKTITLPRDGVYKIRYSRRFQAVQYGFSDYDSYGHPAGTHLADMTLVDTAAPVVTFSMDCNGSVTDGKVVDMGRSQNRSGLAKVHMFHAASSNYTFTSSPFIPGMDTSATWQLSVVDKSRSAIAYLLFVDRAGNTVIDSVIYIASAISSTPEHTAFGPVNVTATMERTVQLRNSSALSARVDTVRLKSGDGFSIISAPTFPVTLQPGATIDIGIRYSPSAAADPRANHSDTLIAVTQCGDFLTGAVSGRGLAPAVSVADLNFQQVPLDSTVCRSLLVFNAGEAALTITEINGIEPPFYIEDPQPSFPITIAPQETYSLRVCFMPTQEQYYTSTVTIVSDGHVPSSDPTATLRGAGTVTTDVGSESGEVVFDCRPNPATDYLRINYALPMAGQVRIEMYNIAGATTHVLYDGVQGAGAHTVDPSVANLAAGVYICRLVTPSGVFTHKITLVK